jgi:hypothetical protein
MPELDERAAYAIQRTVAERAGVPLTGWKVGMVSAIGRGPDTPGPIYGRLLADMEVADGGTIPRGALHAPQVEGEIAFVLGAPLRGPGVTVVLDDSSRRVGDGGPNNPKNDDLVVHQGDVQAVVNALWAGGAEAMSIMDVRVISTSAVRCVGNTLLLHGQVFSPPFRIKAIGEPGRMRQALDSAEGVQQFRDAVADFGLGYQETVERNVTVPAYDGSSDLRSARAAE